MAASPRIYGQLVNILGKYSKFASAVDKAALRQAPAAEQPDAPL
jgi:myo-inositol-1(or 4)-monophosphatase